MYWYSVLDLSYSYVKLLYPITPNRGAPGLRRTRLYSDIGALRLYMELLFIIPKTGMNHVYRTKQNFKISSFIFNFCSGLKGRRPFWLLNPPGVHSLTQFHLSSSFFPVIISSKIHFAFSTWHFDPLIRNKAGTSSPLFLRFSRLPITSVIYLPTR